MKQSAAWHHWVLLSQSDNKRSAFRNVETKVSENNAGEEKLDVELPGWSQELWLLVNSLLPDGAKLDLMVASINAVCHQCYLAFKAVERIHWRLKSFN